MLTVMQVIVICIFLFGLIDCINFSGRHFFPVFVNTTGSSRTTQAYRIINPTTTQNNQVFIETTAGYTYEKIMLPGHSLTLENYKEIRSISSFNNVFFLTETSYWYQLVDVSYFIPTHNLGTEYHVIGFCRYGSSCRITIIGCHNSTSIQFAIKVVPISPVYGINGSEVVDPTFVIIVDSGDIVTFESKGDLSGTFLKGNKKFAVFHSTIVTNIHHIKKGVTRPLLPTESLGARHFMPSTLSQHGGILKIVATKGDTRVELSTMDPIILHKPGDWVTKTITNLDRIVIDSNKPIAVATVDLEMTENIVCPKFNSILTVSPFEQWLGSSHIVIPSLSFGNVPIYIISHEEDKYSTTIDDHNSTGTAKSIPGTAHVETEIIIRGKRKYYSPLTLIPGLLIDEYEDDSFYIQNPNSSFRFFAYYGNIFRLPLNHEINILYDACSPTLMVPGDYEDNDCDGYIDEDVCITLDPSLDCAAPYTSKTGPAGTAGKQFYLAFMNDNDLYIEGNVSITLTPATSLPATIHVESSFSNWKTDFTLNPGDVKQLSARKYEVIVLADVTYQATHGIIITSTSDIVVVAQYISTEIAVSSFIVYPAESIGFDYFAVTDLKGKDGKCVIVCTMNNTVVRIQLSLAANHTLSSSNFRIYRYGEVMSYQMWERQTYQITFTEDITGSRISANKPIAVFCGGNTEDKGFVAEQLLHTQTWGKHYLIPPFPGIKLTVMSRGNKNHVTINSPNCGINMSLTLNYSGSYVNEFFQDISLQTCVINISAEKEISVTVNMPLMWMDVNPSNLVIPSTDQYTSNSMFVVPETPFEASTSFFVGFVSRIGIESFEAVTLDGTLLPNAGYHEIGIGVHNLTTNRDMFVYIFAVSEKKTDGSNLPAYSYAYAAGMLIQQIVQDCIPSLEIVDGVDNDCDGVIDEDPCYTTLNAMGSDNSWMFEEDCNENLLSYTTTITDTSTVDPMTSTAEPMTSTAEPGTSTAEPMTSTVEPGTSTAEPMTSTAEPGTSTAEPMTSTAEPGTSTAEPMTPTAEPGTSTAEPMTSTAEPGTSTAEPMTSTAEPGTSTAEPMTSTAEPGTSTAEPMTSTAEPGTSTAEPMTSTAEPGTSTSEPMTSTAEPGTSTAEAMTFTSARETTENHHRETSTTETTEKIDFTVTNTNGKDSTETTGNSVTTETGNMENTITTDTAESTQSLIPEGSTVTTDEALPDTTIRSTQSNSNQEITGNSVTTETDDVDNTSQGTDTTVGNTCYCPCSVDALNTEEKIQQRLVDLQTSLRVEKRKLSSSVRKLNSATDDRTSVRYLGISGVIILITVVLFIIMLDSINLIKAIKTRFGKYNLS